MKTKHIANPHRQPNDSDRIKAALAVCEGIPTIALVGMGRGSLKAALDAKAFWEAKAKGGAR